MHHFTDGSGQSIKNWIPCDEQETLPRRLSRTGDNAVWWSVFSECSRAGEALFSMVRRDREWELEEGAKEAAW